ncbi:hypothetical protein [Sphingomonas aurea]|nr:hypothetical protein [Sphingomonas sp. KR1UV-12]
MGPITAAAPLELDVVVSRPSSPLVRRAVGVPVLLVAAAAMLPWMALNAAVAGVVLGARGIAAAPKAVVQAIDYAGTVVLGR